MTKSVTFHLYEGTVRLVFTEGNHRYTVAFSPSDGDGSWTKPVWTPSVTGITGATDGDKAGGLIGWATKIFAQEIENALEPNVPHSAAYIKEAAKEARWAHKAESKLAAEFGTRLHEWAEDRFNAIIDGRKSPGLPRERKLKACAQGIEEWITRDRPEPISAERKVYSVAHHYSGTADLLCTIKGVPHVIDFKTSKRVDYVTYDLQLAAYIQALNEEGVEGAPYVGRKIIQVPRETGVLTVRDIYRGEQHGNPTLEDDLEAFNAARVLYRRFREMK
jgi:hypothetical protein